MPLYIFINPETGEEKEVLQKMSEPHVYVDEDGLEWRREFVSPNAAIGMNHDPFSSNDFMEKTRDSDGKNVGDLMDRAEEDSQKRASKNGGVDPIKQKYFKNYSKRRKGKKHRLDPSRNVDGTLSI